MRGKWTRMGPGEKVRRVGEDEWEYKRTGTLRKTRVLNEELQKASKEDPRTVELKGGTGRMIANMPHDVAAEMDRKCGHDPDKRKAFLRDHPEFLTTRDAKLPKRRRVIYSRNRRNR